MSLYVADSDFTTLSETVLGKARYEYYSQKIHEENIGFGTGPRTGKENSIEIIFL